MSIRGKIDRLDTWDGYAAVTDYKSGRKGYPVARWEVDRRMQAALYMLAVRELLGLEPAGGRVRAAGGSQGPAARARARRGGARSSATATRSRTRKSADEVSAELDRARERVREIAARMRTGDVRPCPDTCAWNGGCSYPSICREEG